MDPLKQYMGCMLHIELSVNSLINSVKALVKQTKQTNTKGNYTLNSSRSLSIIIFKKHNKGVMEHQLQKTSPHVGVASCMRYKGSGDMGRLTHHHFMQHRQQPCNTYYWIPSSKMVPHSFLRKLLTWCILLESADTSIIQLL